MVLDAPSLTDDDAVTWALRLFGVQANGFPLPSERHQNFLLQTDGGERFVFKVAHTGESRAVLDAQNAALAHVARRSTLCPSVVPTIDGAAIGEIRSGDATHLARLFTWIAGVPLAEAGPATSALLDDLGARIAELDG